MKRLKIASFLSLTIPISALLAQDFGGLTRLELPEGPAKAEYHRAVRIPGGTTPAVVVCAFYTHGALLPNATNLAVLDSHRHPVPWKALQDGPGDFLRIAFQTVAKEHSYQVEYGGKAPLPASPAWTASAGLLMDTRKYTPCDLNKLPAVRAAFEKAERIGSLYVPDVFHRFNPAAPGPDPYFSRTTGTLHAPARGEYTFFTSSQDCSFLLIDANEVVSAPGAHGPVGQARIKGKVTLTAGPHAFEYLHAAAGLESCLVAAWQPPGAEKPEPIPAAAFGSDAVVSLPAVGPFHLGNRPMHDFTAEPVSEVPLSESDQPIVRVHFRAVGAQSKLHWEFGDGQTGTGGAPTHLYLHPGLYPVKLSAPGEAASLAVTNSVWVDRPAIFADKEHPAEELAAYLPALHNYDAAALDPAGLLQLVRARLEANHAEEAVAAARAAIRKKSLEGEDGTLEALGKLVLPVLRDRLDEPAVACEFARSASQQAEADPIKALFEIEAADVALHDMLKPADARTLLDAATAHLPASAASERPELSARLFRMWGDWYSRKGDAKSARAAYTRAAPLAPGARRPAAEQSSWRGAFGRSTEAFLRDRQPDRALAELRRWQEEFPLDKLDADLVLLQARERAARGKQAQAIALATDLIAIAPDSAFADRLLVLSAECHEKLRHNDAALAAYRSLVHDYPGSPLVPDARKQIERLSASGHVAPAR